MPTDYTQLDKFTLPKNKKEYGSDADISGIIDTYDDSEKSWQRPFRWTARTLRGYERYHARRIKQLQQSLRNSLSGTASDELPNQNDNERTALLANQKTNAIVQTMRVISETCSPRKAYSNSFKAMRAHLANKIFAHLKGDEQTIDNDNLKAKMDFWHEYRNRWQYQRNDKKEPQLLTDIANNVTADHVALIEKLKQRGRVSLITPQLMQAVASMPQEQIKNQNRDLVSDMEHLRQKMARWGAVTGEHKGVKNRLRRIIKDWSNQQEQDQNFVQKLGELGRRLYSSRVDGKTKQSHQLDYDQLNNQQKDQLHQVMTDNDQPIEKTLNKLYIQSELRQDPNMSRLIKDKRNEKLFEQLANNDSSSEQQAINDARHLTALNLTMSRRSLAKNRMHELLDQWHSNYQNPNTEKKDQLNKALIQLGTSLHSGKGKYANKKMAGYQRIAYKMPWRPYALTNEQGQNMLAKLNVDYDQLSDRDKENMVAVIAKANNPELAAKQQLAKHSLRQYLNGQYQKDNNSTKEKAERKLGEQQVTQLVEWLFQNAEVFNRDDISANFVDEVMQVIQSNSNWFQNLSDCAQNNRSIDQIPYYWQWLLQVSTNNKDNANGNTIKSSQHIAQRSQAMWQAARKHHGANPKIANLQATLNQLAAAELNQDIEQPTFDNDTSEVDKINKFKETYQQHLHPNASNNNEQTPSQEENLQTNNQQSNENIQHQQPHHNNTNSSSLTPQNLQINAQQSSANQQPVYSTLQTHVIHQVSHRITSNDQNERQALENKLVYLIEQYSQKDANKDQKQNSATQIVDMYQQGYITYSPQSESGGLTLHLPEEQDVDEFLKEELGMLGKNLGDNNTEHILQQAYQNNALTAEHDLEPANKMTCQ